MDNKAMTFMRSKKNINKIRKILDPKWKDRMTDYKRIYFYMFSFKNSFLIGDKIYFLDGRDLIGEGVVAGEELNVQTIMNAPNSGMPLLGSIHKPIVGALILDDVKFYDNPVDLVKISPAHLYFVNGSNAQTNLSKEEAELIEVSV